MGFKRIEHFMNEPPVPSLRYDVIIEQALRGVVKHVLQEVVQHGLPGAHHFYITFRTKDAGVIISPWLREKYNPTMTIVLQNQFWDLSVSEKYFQVSLTFGGKMEKLQIPWLSLTGFADPSVKFGLQFQELDLEKSEKEKADIAVVKDTSKDKAELTQLPVADKQKPNISQQPSDHKISEPSIGEDKKPEPLDNKVISLDRFRKK